MKKVEEIKKSLCDNIQRPPHLFIERLQKGDTLLIEEKNSAASLKEVFIDLDLDSDYWVIYLEKNIVGLNKVERTKTCEICLVRRFPSDKKVDFYLFEMKSSLGHKKKATIEPLHRKLNDILSRIYFLLMKEKYIFDDIADYKAHFSFFIFYKEKKPKASVRAEHNRLFSILYDSTHQKGLVEAHTFIGKTKVPVAFIDTTGSSSFGTSLSKLLK